MKKLVLMFVAIAAISFASCGGNSKPAGDADTAKVDSTEMTDSMQNDSLQGDSTTEAAPADSVK